MGGALWAQRSGTSARAWRRDIPRILVVALCVAILGTQAMAAAAGETEAEKGTTPAPPAAPASLEVLMEHFASVGGVRARFEEVRRLLGSVTVSIRETSSTLGRPDVKLVDTARGSRAGLIVMGAFGRNRINEYFLGSDAAAVIRTS